jgi:hypothetical protein
MSIETLWCSSPWCHLQDKNRTSLPTTFHFRHLSDGAFVAQPRLLSYRGAVRRWSNREKTDVAEKDSKCWLIINHHDPSLVSSHEKSFAVNVFLCSDSPGPAGIGFAPDGVTENSPVRHHLD